MELHRLVTSLAAVLADAVILARTNKDGAAAPKRAFFENKGSISEKHLLDLAGLVV